jgi:cytochrome P450
MMKVGDEKEMTVKMISLRLMLLNFAAIFPTAGVLTNLLLDLSGADPAMHYWERLRAEIEEVQQECGSVWTEETLARLWKVDSAIKETMRKWSVLSYGMPRKVNFYFGT